MYNRNKYEKLVYDRNNEYSLMYQVRVEYIMSCIGGGGGVIKTPSPLFVPLDFGGSPNYI